MTEQTQTEQAQTERARPPRVIAGRDGDLPDDPWSYDGFQAAEEEAPGRTVAPGLVSIGYIGAALRRKRWLWCLTMAIGVLLGSVLFVGYHKSYADTVTLVLIHDPNEDQNTAIQSDVLLAEDPTMAGLAMKKLGVQGSVGSFLGTYSAAMVNDNLLSITATDSTPQASANEASVLASTFLKYRAQTELGKEQATNASQDQQVVQEQQVITSLNKQISNVSAEQSSAAQQSRLKSLTLQRTNANSILTTLQQSVSYNEANLTVSTTALIAGSKVLNIALPVPAHSRTKYMLEYVGGTILGGLLIGVIIVAVGAIVSTRLRRRDDIAIALGAPVGLSVSSSDTGKRSLMQRDRAQQRDRDLRQVAAYLRSCVPSTLRGPASLTVVAVDDTAFAASAFQEMAVAYVRDAKRVVVADLSGGVLAKALGITDPGVNMISIDDGRLAVVLPAADDLVPIGPESQQSGLGGPSQEVSKVYAGADVFVTFATLDPAIGAVHLRTWASNAVAIVTAGRSTGVKVQAAGEMIRFGGTHLASAVLIGADKDDESLGFANAM